MNEIQMRVECAVRAHEQETPEELEALFDRILDAFYDLEDVRDQSVEYYGAKSLLVFDMIFDAQDQIDAVVRGYSFVRSAIHEAGGHTPGWEDAVQAIRHQIATMGPRENALANAELVATNA